MSKYARDLDENLEKKVRQMAVEIGLKAQGVNVEPIRLKKATTYIGEVVKGNDIVKLFTGDDNFVAVALYEEAFNLVKEETQNIWIESLLRQIEVNEEKETITIKKPELPILKEMYYKYKDVIVKQTELAILTIQQIEEMKKEAKESKKNNKKQKNS